MSPPDPNLLLAKQARAYIARHPGCTALAVGEAVPGVMMEHMEFLERRSYVTAKRNKAGEWRYWVCELGVEE